MDASHLASLLGGLGLGEGEEEAPPPPPPRQLASFDLDGLAAKISESKNIIVMAGAGECSVAGSGVAMDLALPCPPSLPVWPIPRPIPVVRFDEDKVLSFTHNAH